ncbi:MAG: RNA methyltransferase [Bdellovibrionaceae bacterium]|nr:RNA methyltransferase [Bdellovibrionales bacterium]MCB0385147.1 RNA methyltransferase [Bdellovibrionales bacterium]MCB9082943.1 RNA methyltransferase [Pseudobdellovibrionaceae bacterium]
MKVISSKFNSRYRYWKDLLESRGLKQSGDFLIIGRKLVPEFLERHPEAISEILLYDTDQRDELPLTSTAQIYLVDKALFKQIDVFGTHYPIAVAKQSPMDKWESKSSPTGLEVFSALGDPANLGALLRCCEAFSVKKLILLEESVHPFHPKCVRASAGSCYRVPLEWGPSIHQDLGSFHALDQSGVNLTGFSWPENGRLLFGEEGKGLPENKKNQSLLRIPMNDSLESLNAVSAASIALFHYRLQYPC